MIELTVLSAVMVVFKAAFAGADLDRKVGAEVVSTVLNGLLRTTSAEDPVLALIRDDVKQLTVAPYVDAMGGGHRYLAEAQVSPPMREERLKLARGRLVDAASAAQRLGVPMLIANAELAIAKCDALLGAAAHARMALVRAAAALEVAIEDLEVSNARLRWLNEARQQQDSSVSQWLSRLVDRELVRAADIEAAERALDEVMATLTGYLELYSEVQTALLAAAGHDRPVIWAPPLGGSIRNGLRDKAVIITAGAAPVCGFGLTLCVERLLVWRPPEAGGKLVADLLAHLSADEPRWLYCCSAAVPIGPAPLAPTPITARAAETRAANPTRSLLSHFPFIFEGVQSPDSISFRLPAGSRRGWLRVPIAGATIDVLHIRPSRVAAGGVRISTGGCFRIPVTPGA